MWSVLVLILPPTFNHFPCKNNIAEPVIFQAYLSKSSVKTLNKSVLSRIARLDKTQLHTVLIGLLIQSSAGGFQPLIGSDRRQIATKQRDTVQNTRDLYAGNPECVGNFQALLREIIYANQAFDPMTNGQRIHNEIHRLGQIWCIRTEKRKPSLALNGVVCALRSIH